MRYVSVAFLFAMVLPAAAAAPTVNLRIYACEGAEPQGSQSSYIPFGDETRFGIFPGWAKDAPNVLFIACRVVAGEAPRVQCHALRGAEKRRENLPTMVVPWGGAKTIAVTGDNGEDLTLRFEVFRPGTEGDFGGEARHCPPPRE
jgi:hypothetical protein